MENTQTCQLRISLKYFTDLYGISPAKPKHWLLEPKFDFGPFKKGKLTSGHFKLGQESRRKPEETRIGWSGGNYTNYTLPCLSSSPGQIIGGKILKLQTMFFLWGTGNYVLLFCSNQYTWCVCVFSFAHVPFIHFWGRRKSFMTWTHHSVYGASEERWT